MLALRFARSGKIWASTLVVAVAAMLVATWYCLLQAQSLTGEQVADRDLGRFQAYAGFGAGSIGPGESINPLRSRIASVAGRTADVSLVIPDFYATSVAPGAVTLTERTWQPAPFPGRYRVLSGRWPHHSGEVVIANPAPRHAGLARIDAYGGRARLTVVGTVDDPFSREATLLCAPGTWAGFDPNLAAGKGSLRAYPVIYWDGRHTDRVLSGIANAFRELGYSPGGRAPVGEVRSSFNDRATLSAKDAQSWIEQSPAGYALPSILLPFAAAGLSSTAIARRLRASIAAMKAVGLSHRTAVTGVATSLTTCTLLTAVVGTVAGLAVGLLAARAFAGVLSYPTPPIPNLLAPFVPILSATLGGCVSAVWALWSPRSRRSGTATTDRWPARRLRWYLAMAAVVAIGWQARGLKSASDALWLGAIWMVLCLLITPALARVTIRRLRQTDLRSRLTLRQLESDATRTVTTTAVIGGLIGLSTGFVALLDTMIRTADTQTYSAVLPGQVKLADRSVDLLRPPAAVVAVARTVPDLQRQKPVVLQYLAVIDARAALVSQVRAGQGLGLILVVDEAAVVDRLFGIRLTPAQSRTLTGGGLLTWAPAPAQVMLGHYRSDRSVGTPVSVSTHTLQVPNVGWVDGTDGVLLRSTAARLGLPVTMGAEIYTGVSDAGTAAVRAAVDRAGLDPTTVVTYQAPRPAIPPLALYLSAVGVAIMAIGVTAALARTHAAVLRGYLGHLLALGIPLGWLRSVLHRQMAVLLAMATPLGLAIGAIPAATAAWLIPGFRLSIPWGQVAVLLAAIYLSAILTTLFVGRRLSPNVPSV